MRIPELRSPYDKVDGLVYFGRMIDKIRLHTAGKLPAEYVPNLGASHNFQSFDGRCCRFFEHIFSSDAGGMNIRTASFFACNRLACRSRPL